MGHTGTVPAYDADGNTRTLAGQTFTWDGAGRSTGASAGGTTVTWGRDAADRVTTRTTGVTSVKYGYTGPGDAAGWIVADGQAYLQVMLPGGALLSTAHSSHRSLAVPDLHGDTVLTLDLNGNATGALGVYDPDGQPLSPATGLLDTDAVPDTSYGSADNAWVGQWGKQYEHAGTLALIQMGARPYLPALARFLSIDPVEGGTPNDYTYPDDPVNQYDLDGEAVFVPLLVIGARVALHYGMRRAAMWSAQRAVQTAANQAQRQYTRQGWRHVVSERQQQYSFARGRELHLRTAKILERRGVSYGRASGPAGTPRRFSPDFRFGNGCYGGHGCLGVELKTWRGGSHSVGGWLR